MRTVKTLLPVLAVILAGCSTHIATRHVSSMDAVLRDEGIHYYLPRTVVRISLPVTETTTRPGPYADLAPLFFPYLGPGRILGETTTYSIDPSAVTFTSRGVRDPLHHYVVNPKGQWWADTNFKFSIGSDGVVNKFDITVENRSVDLALTTAEVIAGLASKLATKGVAASADAPLPPPPPLNANKNAPRPPPPPLPKWVTSCPFYDGDLADMSARQKEVFVNIAPAYGALYCYLFPEDRDELFDGGSLRVLLTYVKDELAATATDFYALRRSTKPRKFFSARALIEELQQIQTNNAELLGSIPENATAELWHGVLDARAARVKEILSQFLGTKTKDPAFALAAFDITLDDTSNGDIDLFTISADEGICRISQDTDVRRSVSTLPLVACMGGTAATWQIALASFRLTLPTSGGNASIPTDESGLRYRVPGRAAFVLKATSGPATQELGRIALDIAQYGAIASLPPKAGGMKTQYTVELDSATGALREITVGNAGALTSDAITRTGAVAGSLVDTRRARNPPEPAPPTAQELVEKERKLKSEQLKIRLLDECLKDPSKAGCAELVK